jgi:Protein of unknown function (DUF3224)
MHRLLLALAALALAAGLAGAAGAGPPGTAAGLIAADELDITFFTRGPNFFTQITGTGTISGTFNGPQVSTYDEVVNPTGDSTLQGTTVCDPCSVDGRSGTVVFRQAGTIIGDPFHLELRTVVVSATGALKGLHANVVVTWDGVGAAPYSGTYHFDP